MTLKAPVVYNFDACSEGKQYELHQTLETIIDFGVPFGNVRCRVYLIFKPFHRLCNLTYHEYEVHCSLPSGASQGDISQWKSLIVDTAQRIYDKCFFANAGYKLAILQSELHCSNEAISHAVTHKQVQIPASDEGTRRKRQKLGHADNIVQPQTTANNLTTGDSWISYTPRVTILDVEDSYKRAIAAGRLKSTRLPLLVEEKDASRPYTLTIHALRYALLDANKVEDIVQRVCLTTQIVPIAAEWIAKIEEYDLTENSVELILRDAFGPDALPLGQRPKSFKRLPTALELAVQGLQRADDYEAKAVTMKRAGAIMRLVAYALLEVSVAIGEDSQAGTWDGRGGKKWLERSRTLARFWCWSMSNMPHWQERELPLYLLLTQDRGEKSLRDLFQAALPAGAGEFISTLESELYWKDLPVSKGLPGVVEIVIELLSGRVSPDEVRRALGCAYSCPSDENSSLSNDPQSDIPTYSRAATLFRSFKCKASSSGDLYQRLESSPNSGDDAEPGLLRPSPNGQNWDSALLTHAQVSMGTPQTSGQLTTAEEPPVNNCSATQTDVSSNQQNNRALHIQEDYLIPRNTHHTTARCPDTVTSTSPIVPPLIGDLSEFYENDPFLDEILNGAVLGSNEITDPYLAEILFEAAPETAEFANYTSHHVRQPARPIPHSIVAESFNHKFTINEATVLRSSSTTGLNPVPDLTYNPIAAHTLGRANGT